MINYQNAIERCKELALLAGDAIMEIYGTEFTVETKEDASPLTLADTRANAIIVQGLRENFPSCAVLSEESKAEESRRQNELCFIVDPLDGTKEFIKHNGQFTVNIALACQGKTVLGVVYAPAMKHLYYAYSGGGAFFEDTQTGMAHSIHVSDRKKGLTMVGSSSHVSEQDKAIYENHQEKIDKTIAIGSSLKGCLVASGEADVYYRFGLTSEWDTAAMQCVVEEAGGIFRQMDSSPMLYNREDILNREGFYVVNREENIWV